MNLHLNIERLILEGINLTPSQRRQLQEVVTAELTRLMTEQGIPPGVQSIALPRVPIQIPASATSPAQIGQQIAQNIYTGLGQPHQR